LFFCFISLAFVLAVRPAHAGDERAFSAFAFQYDASQQAPVVSKKFDCKIKFAEQGGVRIITISSFMSGKSDPDVTIRVISSNNSVANIVYNSKMEVVAEYPKGEVASPNMFLFKTGDDKRKVEGKWYLDKDSLMSEFTVSDPAGHQIYKETVIYLANSPSRK